VNTVSPVLEEQTERTAREAWKRY